MTYRRLFWPHFDYLLTRENGQTSTTARTNLGLCHKKVLGNGVGKIREGEVKEQEGTPNVCDPAASYSALGGQVPS
jgi:hypothetical protein